MHAVCGNNLQKNIDRSATDTLDGKKTQSRIETAEGHILQNNSEMPPDHSENKSVWSPQLHEAFSDVMVGTKAADALPGHVALLSPAVAKAVQRESFEWSLPAAAETEASPKGQMETEEALDARLVGAHDGRLELSKGSSPVAKRLPQSPSRGLPSDLEDPGEMRSPSREAADRDVQEDTEMEPYGISTQQGDENKGTSKSSPGATELNATDPSATTPADPRKSRTDSSTEEPFPRSQDFQREEALKGERSRDDGDKQEKADAWQPLGRGCASSATPVQPFQVAATVSLGANSGEIETLLPEYREGQCPKNFATGKGPIKAVPDDSTRQVKESYSFAEATNGPPARLLSTEAHTTVQEVPVASETETHKGFDASKVVNSPQAPGKSSNVHEVPQTSAVVGKVEAAEASEAHKVFEAPEILNVTSSPNASQASETFEVLRAPKVLEDVKRYEDAIAPEIQTDPQISNVPTVHDNLLARQNSAASSGDEPEALCKPVEAKVFRVVQTGEAAQVTATKPHPKILAATGAGESNCPANCGDLADRESELLPGGQSIDLPTSRDYRKVIDVASTFPLGVRLELQEPLKGNTHESIKVPSKDREGSAAGVETAEELPGNFHFPEEATATAIPPDQSQMHAPAKSAADATVVTAAADISGKRAAVPTPATAAPTQPEQEAHSVSSAKVALVSSSDAEPLPSVGSQGGTTLCKSKESSAAFADPPPSSHLALKRPQAACQRQNVASAGCVADAEKAVLAVSGDPVAPLSPVAEPLAVGAANTVSNAPAEETVADPPQPLDSPEDNRLAVPLDPQSILSGAGEKNQRESVHLFPNQELAISSPTLPAPCTALQNLPQGAQPAAEFVACMSNAEKSFRAVEQEVAELQPPPASQPASPVAPTEGKGSDPSFGTTNSLQEQIELGSACAALHSGGRSDNEEGEKKPRGGKEFLGATTLPRTHIQAETNLPCNGISKAQTEDLPGATTQNSCAVKEEANAVARTVQLSASEELSTSLGSNGRANDAKNDNIANAAVRNNSNAECRSSAKASRSSTMEGSERKAQSTTEGGTVCPKENSRGSFPSMSSGCSVRVSTTPLPPGQSSWRMQIVGHSLGGAPPATNRFSGALDSVATKKLSEEQMEEPLVIENVVVKHAPITAPLPYRKSPESSLRTFSRPFSPVTEVPKLQETLQGSAAAPLVKLPSSYVSDGQSALASSAANAPAPATGEGAGRVQETTASHLAAELCVDGVRPPVKSFQSNGVLPPRTAPSNISRNPSLFSPGAAGVCRPASAVMSMLHGPSGASVYGPASGAPSMMPICEKAGDSSPVRTLLPLGVSLSPVPAIPRSISRRNSQDPLPTQSPTASSDRESRRLPSLPPCPNTSTSIESATQLTSSWSNPVAAPGGPKLTKHVSPVVTSPAYRSGTPLVTAFRSLPLAAPGEAQRPPTLEHVNHLRQTVDSPQDGAAKVAAAATSPMFNPRSPLPVGLPSSSVTANTEGSQQPVRLTVPRKAPGSHSHGSLLVSINPRPPNASQGSAGQGGDIPSLSFPASLLPTGRPPLVKWPSTASPKAEPSTALAKPTAPSAPNPILPVTAAPAPAATAAAATAPARAVPAAPVAPAKMAPAPPAEAAAAPLLRPAPATPFLILPATTAPARAATVKMAPAPVATTAVAASAQAAGAASAPTVSASALAELSALTLRAIGTKASAPAPAAQASGTKALTAAPATPTTTARAAAGATAIPTAAPAAAPLAPPTHDNATVLNHPNVPNVAGGPLRSAQWLPAPAFSRPSTPSFSTSSLAVSIYPSSGRESPLPWRAPGPCASHGPTPSAQPSDASVCSVPFTRHPPPLRPPGAPLVMLPARRPSAFVPVPGRQPVSAQQTQPGGSLESVASIPAAGVVNPALALPSQTPAVSANPSMMRSLSGRPFGALRGPFRPPFSPLLPPLIRPAEGAAEAPRSALQQPSTSQGQQLEGALRMPTLQPQTSLTSSAPLGVTESSAAALQQFMRPHSKGGSSSSPTAAQNSPQTRRSPAQANAGETEAFKGIVKCPQPLPRPAEGPGFLADGQFNPPSTFSAATTKPVFTSVLASGLPRAPVSGHPNLPSTAALHGTSASATKAAQLLPSSLSAGAEMLGGPPQVPMKLPIPPSPPPIVPTMQKVEQQHPSWRPPNAAASPGQMFTPAAIGFSRPATVVPAEEPPTTNPLTRVDSSTVAARNQTIGNPAK